MPRRLSRLMTEGYRKGNHAGREDAIFYIFVITCSCRFYIFVTSFSPTLCFPFFQTPI